MSSITSSPVRAALPPQADFASGPASVRQLGQVGAAGIAAEECDPPILTPEELERVKLRADVMHELSRALVSLLRDPTPVSLSQQSIDGLRSLGIPIDTLLAENGNVWDEAGIGHLMSLLAPPRPPHWEANPGPGSYPVPYPVPYPAPYPYPIGPTSPLGDSTRANLTRPYV